MSTLSSRPSGSPPGKYLIHWRMMIARDALKNGRDTLSDIAMRVGYASENSFSAAFKNVFARVPGVFARSFNLRIHINSSNPQPSDSRKPFVAFSTLSIP
jgi:AraC-like DNA-binding protein